MPRRKKITSLAQALTAVWDGDFPYAMQLWSEMAIGVDPDNTRVHTIAFVKDYYAPMIRALLEHRMVADASFILYKIPATLREMDPEIQGLVVRVSQCSIIPTPEKGNDEQGQCGEGREEGR